MAATATHPPSSEMAQSNAKQQNDLQSKSSASSLITSVQRPVQGKARVLCVHPTMNFCACSDGEKVVLWDYIEAKPLRENRLPATVTKERPHDIFTADNYGRYPVVTSPGPAEKGSYGAANDQIAAAAAAAAAVSTAREPGTGAVAGTAGAVPAPAAGAGAGAGPGVGITISSSKDLGADEVRNMEFIDYETMRLAGYSASSLSSHSETSDWNDHPSGEINSRGASNNTDSGLAGSSGNGSMSGMDSGGNGFIAKNVNAALKGRRYLVVVRDNRVQMVDIVTSKHMEVSHHKI